MPKYPAWEQEYAEVKDLLNYWRATIRGAIIAAVYMITLLNSVMNAHYTSGSYWRNVSMVALEQMGYKKGNC